MRRATACLAGLWLGVALLATSAGAAPDQCGADVPGTPSVYLGAWIPAALDDPRLPLERDPLGKFNALAGKRVSIVQRWEHWGLGAGGNIDVGWLQRVVQAGAFPMVTWDPWNPNANPPDRQRGFLMRDIANGARDVYIAKVAAQVARWDGPIFIRFAQEMNGTWFPWGKHQNSPDDYIAAWRHIHEVFDQQGAGQVTWVWNPSEKNHPESMGFWYPGDDVVDWIALDGYNWDDSNYWRDASGNTWRTLDMIFGASFADIATFAAADKPWMLAETASTERGGNPGVKATWICDAFRRVLPQVFPQISAILWFQEQKAEAGRPFNWPVDSSSASAEAFGAAVAPPYYAGDLGDRPALLGRNKIPPPAALP